MNLDTDMRRYHAALGTSWYAGRALLLRIADEHGRDYAKQVRRAWREQYGYRFAPCQGCDCGKRT